MDFKPYIYQQRAIDFIVEHTHCALFLDMGLGKTVSTLTAIVELMNRGEVASVLVLAPLSVARNTWTSEVAKWRHLSWLKVRTITTPKDWRNLKALREPATIYVTNVDNTIKLLKGLKTLGKRIDMLVLDESSKFKAHDSKRFKALSKESFARVVELTGTPAPNGLMDLWAQIYLLDKGVRLKRFYTSFQREYFTPLQGNGPVTYKWQERPTSRKDILNKISDITLSMTSEDYLDLPEVSYLSTYIDMEERDLARYKAFSKDLILNTSGGDIVALTAAALLTKLTQYCSGYVYDKDHNAVLAAHYIYKLDMLKDIVEASSSNILLFYAYKFEVDIITQAFPRAVMFKGEPDILDCWNKGEIKLLIAHPASVSYGLNIQFGGHTIVWYTMTWNLEHYMQANARLNRQGQEHKVLIYHLITRGTVEERIYQALQDKENLQDNIVDELKNNG